MAGAGAGAELLSCSTARVKAAAFSELERQRELRLER